MSFVDHPLNYRRIWRSSINLTLSKVVTSDKEGCMEPERLQGVEELASIKIRSIIISQSHDTLLGTVINVLSIGNRSQQWTRIVDS